MSGWLGAFIVTASLFGGPVPAYDQARELYERTEYHESLANLNKVQQKDAKAYELIGQNYFMLGDYKKATEYFEKATQLDPHNSEIVHWLGRTFGRRAETGSFLTAPSNASKARQYFEKAVELDPKNQEAVNDLFDFYLEAPGFLGGGINKAEELARHIESLNPAEGHYARAQIDDKKKDYEDAEEHLRKAAELSPHQVGRVVDVAQYLAKLGKFVESELMFERAAKMAPQEPKVLYHRAESYIKSNRNLPQARKLLEQYMQSKLTPDDPSRAQAEALLKKIPN
jgi:Flp pilus assembly protein TadD